MSLQIFKSRLKAKIKTLGVNNLSNERIDAYAATLHKKNPDLKDDDEAGHDAAITDLSEYVDFKKVATEDDRFRNLETQLKKNTPPAKKGNEPDEDEEDEEEDDDNDNEPAASTKKKNNQEPKKKDRTPAWAKTLMEEVQSLKKEKQVATIESKIKSHEKMKDVPEDFYEDYVKPDKEDDIDAFADKVSTKYAKYKQEQKNTTAASQSRPVNSGADTKGKADEKEVDAILDNLMPGTKAPAATAK